MDTMKANRSCSCSSIIKTLKDYGWKFRLLYPAKLPITTEVQNKIFHRRTIFTQYLATNPIFTKYYKENSNPRELTTSTKTETIELMIS